jgi:hypothetical protein
MKMVVKMTDVKMTDVKMRDDRSMDGPKTADHYCYVDALPFLHSDLFG